MEKSFTASEIYSAERSFPHELILLRAGTVFLQVIVQRKVRRLFAPMS